jgi:hypothetical protein
VIARPEPPEPCCCNARPSLPNRRESPAAPRRGRQGGARASPSAPYDTARRRRRPRSPIAPSAPNRPYLSVPERGEWPPRAAYTATRRPGSPVPLGRFHASRSTSRFSVRDAKRHNTRLQADSARAQHFVLRSVPAAEAQNVGRAKPMARGCGRYAKWIRTGRFARVELEITDRDGAAVTFECRGRGFYSQGYVEEVTSGGYADWKEGAAAGVGFAFRLLGADPRAVTITKIEGLGTDTSPAAVGAAAVLAVLDALAIPIPDGLPAKLDQLVFSTDFGAPFSPR